MFLKKIYNIQIGEKFLKLVLLNSWKGEVRTTSPEVQLSTFCIKLIIFCLDHAINTDSSYLIMFSFNKYLLKFLCARFVGHNVDQDKYSPGSHEFTVYRGDKY